MATITSTIKLVDQMTPTLNKINRAIENTNKQSKAINNAKSWSNFTTGATGATRAVNNLYNAIRRTVFIISSLLSLKVFINIADTMMNATARIDNINDGLYDTAQYMDMIYASAQRSRGSFTDMASQVAKLGTVAGEAFGGNVQHVIAFAELLNKSFRIGGASATEASSSAYQLTQALASGVLQGEELKAILENAPLVAQAIAKELGVSVGELKAMGAAGEITSDMIIKAMFGAAEQIEERFENLPKTIGDIWTEIKNHAVNAFRPVIERVKDFINSPAFEKFKSKVLDLITKISNGVIWMFDQFRLPVVQNALDKIVTGLKAVWSLVTTVGEAMRKVASAIIDSWDDLAPIIFSVVAALTAYVLVSKVLNIVTAIGKFLIELWVTGMWKVLLIVGIVVAAIFLLCKAFNDLFGTSISAIGVIAGVIAFVVATVWDSIVFLLDSLSTIWDSTIFLIKLVWNVIKDVFWTIITTITDVVMIIIGAVITALALVLQTISTVWTFLVDLTKSIVEIIKVIASVIWNTFVNLVETIVTVLTNVVIAIGLLLASILAAIGYIGQDIWSTLVWIGETAVVFFRNTGDGIRSLVDFIGACFSWLGAQGKIIFYNIALGGIEAFNDLITSAGDGVNQMLTPFVSFYNACVDIFNKIVDAWNNSIGKANFVIKNPFTGEEHELGFGTMERAGKIDVKRNIVAGSGLYSTINGYLDAAVADREAAEAIIGAGVNWGSNEYPDYKVDWSDNWSEISDLWNSFDLLNIFGSWSAEDYTKPFDDFVANLKDTWNAEDYPDWKNTFSELKGLWGSLGLENPLETWADGDYGTIWDEFVTKLKDTWKWDDYSNPFAAFKKWYDIGDGLSEGMQGLADLFQHFTSGDLADIFGGNSSILNDDWKKKNPSSLESLLGGDYNPDDTLGAIADNTGKAAGSTANIEDTLDLAEEELELLRKLAEQEVINRFTTAEIHVDMTNNNNVNSNMDLDGIVTHLSNKLYEELGVVASGVHY